MGDDIEHDRLPNHRRQRRLYLHLLGEQQPFREPDGGHQRGFRLQLGVDLHHRHDHRQHAQLQLHAGLACGGDPGNRSDLLPRIEYHRAHRFVLLLDDHGRDREYQHQLPLGRDHHNNEPQQQPDDLHSGAPAGPGRAGHHHPARCPVPLAAPTEIAPGVSDMMPRVSAPEDRRAYTALLAIAGGLLLVLPFVTTFDDFLTAGAIRLGITGPAQAVGPFEARMVVAVLSALGVHAGVNGSELIVWNLSGQPQALFISWNCVGWQSLILLGISLVAGLRGRYSVAARIQVVLIGVLGTLCVNLLRMSAVALLAATAGRVPALLFHDYGGTLIVIAWLFCFWALAYRWILSAGARADEPAIDPAALEAA